MTPPPRRHLRPLRPPDWLVYIAVAMVLIVLAVRSRPRADPPAAPRPPAEQPGARIGPASLFDPTIVVKAPLELPGAGTAFSVADSGVWLTARHVVEGCARAAIIAAPGRGVAASVKLSPGRETAVLITQGGAPALPLGPERIERGGLRRGALAFHPGFPHQGAGAAVSRLIGRDTLIVRGHGLRAEPVLAWQEVGRTPGLTGDLEGLSGAPALDADGRVIGVTIAEAPRRGRIYTTTPSSVRIAMASAGVTPSTAAGQALGMETYGRVADDLRHDLRVAQVVCLGR